MKIYSVNPANEKKLGSFELLGYNSAVKSVKKAREAFLVWKEKSVHERAELAKKLAQNLRKRNKELALIITREMGKPISESRAEIEKCAWLCDYYSKNSPDFLKDEAVKTDAKKSYITFEPLGIILGIMPWNFPFWQVFRFAVPALCAGNACILKHSSNVPRCAKAIESIFLESGYPKGVFSNLLINSETAMKIIDSDLIQGVSLTGSVEAGRKIAEAAGRNLKKVVLELGGSDPYIVFEDADLNLACSTAVKARLINAGQSCISAKRFIVARKVGKEFEKRLVAHLAQLKIGDPEKEDANVGPLARRDLAENLDRQIRDSVKKGAKIIYGGKRIDGKGYYFMPSVLTNLREGMAVIEEETFGPVFSIIYFDDEDEAIKIANGTNFGLGGSVWSRDIKRAERAARKVEAGVVFVNGFVKSDPRLPFGGIKNSGIGRELSHYGIKEFVNIKTVVVEK